jgi:hypothetical protein
MDSKCLVKGTKYLYTASIVAVEITYLHESINGFVFKKESGTTHELSRNQVEKFINSIS